MEMKIYFKNWAWDFISRNLERIAWETLNSICDLTNEHINLFLTINISLRNYIQYHQILYSILESSSSTNISPNINSGRSIFTHSLFILLCSASKLAFGIPLLLFSWEYRSKTSFSTLFSLQKLWSIQLQYLLLFYKSIGSSEVFLFTLNILLKHRIGYLRGFLLLLQ